MWRIILVLLCALSAVTPLEAKSPGVILGYIAAFKGLDREMQQQGLDEYTHVVLAFVNPTPAGEFISQNALACAPAGNGTMISDAQLRLLVASMHAKGTKVIVSLGGAIIPACSGNWEELLQDQSRAKLLSSIVKLVDQYDLDGVDIDLEGDLMRRIDAAGNYTPFVRELAAELHARSRIITAATGSYPGGMIPASSLSFFDIISLMSYDAVGPTWGTPGGEHSTYAQAQSDLSLWIGKGISPSRLALGVPFYGRGFGSYREGWSIGEIAQQFGDSALNSDVVGKRCAGCSYITYNGLQTLERKAELAGAWGAGVMVWEAGQDLPDARAIRNVVHGYTKGRALAGH